MRRLVGEGDRTARSLGVVSSQRREHRRARDVVPPALAAAGPVDERDAGAGCDVTADGRSNSRGPRASIHHETPANRPVLRLHLVTPAECGGAIVEVSIAKRTVVDKPDNHCSAWTRTNYGVSQQAVWAPHSPHDRRLVIHQSHRILGHGSREASVIPARRVAFFSEAA